MSTPPPTARSLAPALLLRVGLAVPVFLVLFFLPAGTWDYWEAWVFLAVLLLPLTVAVVYLARRSPDLLVRRMRYREREAAQQRIVTWAVIPLLGSYILPGIDHRFGWSDVPTAVVLAADAAVLAGYLLVILVFRENRFASRVVEVEPDQTVVSTGPYAVVRHPMYVGVLVMYLLGPLALGSYWAVLIALPLVWVLVARIQGEEEVLRRDLPGYDAYCAKVRYRLLPGLW